MTQALRAAVTGGAVAKRPQSNTIAGLLSDPKIKQQMALALPKHMTADRLARIALTEVRKTPALGKCDQASFLGAIMQCAQLGLEPGGALGHAYLLPFENRSKGITEVQFIVGYRGMLDLARRSGQIQSIEARVVYAGDQFSVVLGLNPDLQHVPDWESPDRGPAQLRFVYAVAKLKDGGTQFEVMSRADIERVRASSKSGAKPESPWSKHFEEMAKKTVIRRLFKYLPVSIELAQAVGMDEQSEAGLPQDNPLTIDSDTGEITGGDAQTEQADETPTLTFAQVADQLQRATSTDTLAVAADLIGQVADEGQRAELAGIYQQLSEKFAG